MTRTVEFAHDIGDRVTVTAIEMVGHIDSLSLDNNGNMYRVVYWNDGQRFSTWMYDWELENHGALNASLERPAKRGG